MIWMKRLFQRTVSQLLNLFKVSIDIWRLSSRSNPIRSVALVLGTVLIFVSLFTPAQARQGHPPATNSPSLSAQYVPPRPPNQGSPPGNRRGGASRGACPASETHLTALVPEAETSSARDLTTTAYPTFWFYLPYLLTPETSAEFVLLDQDNSEVYHTAFTHSEAIGIIQVSLPATAKPLEVGKVYQWVFLVNCEVDNPIFTRGGIQRITLDAAIANQIQQALPQEQTKLYGTQGIWFDALTTQAKLYLAHPQDEAIATAWRDLIASVGLADIANQPLLPCCTPE